MRPSDFKKPLDFMKPFAILLALFSMPLYANPIQQSLYSQKDSITLVYESRYLTNQATKLIKNGDTRTAAALLLRALPVNLQNPDRPVGCEDRQKAPYGIFRTW